MAFDGAFLHLMKHEIEQTALLSRIDKIHQPSREEIILALRFRGGVARLLLSADASCSRVHFTQERAENPQSPPMFCMLLRKHLNAGKLIRVRQEGMDRILYLDFETVNELSDTVVNTLVIEIMGRHSNVILVDENGIIIDAVKRVDLAMSSVRQILPGMRYKLPPIDESKLDFLRSTPEEITAAALEGPDAELSKCLLRTLTGVSPLTCREIADYTTRGIPRLKSELDSHAADRLRFAVGQVADAVRGCQARPTMLCDKTGAPKDFSFLDIKQYGASMLSKRYDTLSLLLDAFYSERDVRDRMKQRSGDLLRLLVNASDRIARKLETRRQELAQSIDRDHLRVCGDLISANLYRLEKGGGTVTLENFYDDNAPMEIRLDPRLTPSQNAQKYYSDYKKAVTAEKKLTQFIEESEQEALYIDSVFDALSRATSEKELTQIREELSESGYLKRYHPKNKKPERLPPKRYRSSDGFTILVGRNNLQNDRLTLKDAHNYDIWFHTQKIPGSHTVIVTEGREVPDRTLEEAAKLAAYNSKAQHSSLVPVDYTFIKNVKKMPGAKPGMVIYTEFKTAIVTPGKELADALCEDA